MNTVLIVDDSATDRSILKNYLEQLGFVVSTANSGEEALEQIKHISQKPNLIMLDVVLPGMSGFETCRSFKSQDTTKDIPVIICSIKATETDKYWGKKQGAEGYLGKPVDQAELNHLVAAIQPA